MLFNVITYSILRKINQDGSFRCIQCNAAMKMHLVKWGMLEYIVSTLLKDWKWIRYQSYEHWKNITGRNPLMAVWVTIVAWTYSDIFCQLTELESYSKPLKMQKVLWFQFKKLGNVGFELFCCGVTTRVGQGLFRWHNQGLRKKFQVAIYLFYL